MVKSADGVIVSGVKVRFYLTGLLVWEFTTYKKELCWDFKCAKNYIGVKEKFGQ